MKCLLCKSEEIKKTGIRKSEYELCFCRDCGLGFVDPIPSNQAIENYYNNYLDEKGYKYLNENLRRYKIGHIWGERYELVNKYLKKKKDVFFLEIGVGTGEWIDLLEQKKEKNSFGIEMSDDEYKILSDKFGNKIQNIELINYENNDKFDVICLWDVLEHLSELNNNMEKIKRMLNDDGLIAFAVPNIDSFSWMIKKDKWKYFSPPEHIFYFNKKSIKYLAEKFGFKLIHYDTKIQFQAYLYDNNCDSKIDKINMFAYNLKQRLESFLNPFIFDRGDIITFILQKHE